MTIEDKPTKKSKSKGFNSDKDNPSVKEVLEDIKLHGTWIRVEYWFRKYRIKVKGVYEK